MSYDLSCDFVGEGGDFLSHVVCEGVDGVGEFGEGAGEALCLGVCVVLACGVSLGVSAGVSGLAGFLGRSLLHTNGLVGLTRLRVTDKFS